MIVHKNTLSAYHKQLPNISKRRNEVYNFVLDYGRPISAKRVSLLTGSLQHSISARFTELVELGYFRECTGDDAFEIIDGYKNRNCVAIHLN